MKEVAKMLSSLKGCLAKRLKSDRVVIAWNLDGFSRINCNSYATITIILQDKNISFQFDFNENTSYIKFYKEILKTISNE